ncbi:ankyrin repeat-containing domain protein [Lactarius deliciosus]|nr:ankyrin repeat-containing domain protein [Lactarius deliciosus]
MGWKNCLTWTNPTSRWIRIHDMNCPWRPGGDMTRLEAAPVYYAALCGLHDMVDKLISEHPEHLNTFGGDDGTALHAASGGSHIKVVQSLLKHGADVNGHGILDWTPLHIASRWGHFEIVQLLLEHDADANAQDTDHWTPLHHATAYGHFELGYNADIDAQTEIGSTPLRVATENGHVNIARFLLDNGANPDARTRDQLEVVHLLLERGVDVDAEIGGGYTAYELALGCGHDEIAQSL